MKITDVKCAVIASAPVIRITTDGASTNYSTGLIPGKHSDIAAGADGAMWFTLTTDPGAIGRITMDGTVSSHTVGLTPGRGPAGCRRPRSSPRRSAWSPGTPGRAGPP